MHDLTVQGSSCQFYRFVGPGPGVLDPGHFPGSSEPQSTALLGSTSLPLSLSRGPSSVQVLMRHRVAKHGAKIKRVAFVAFANEVEYSPSLSLYKKSAGVAHIVPPIFI